MAAGPCSARIRSQSKPRIRCVALPGSPDLHYVVVASPIPMALLPPTATPAATTSAPCTPLPVQSRALPASRCLHHATYAERQHKFATIMIAERVFGSNSIQTQPLLIHPIRDTRFFDHCLHHASGMIGNMSHGRQFPVKCNVFMPPKISVGRLLGSL